MDFTLLAMHAMKTGKRMSLTYNDEQRLVEVHAVGVSSKGKPCVRVYQVIGGSHFSETTGWKMMTIDKIENPVLLEDPSLAPRPGYKPGDIGMGKILMEVSNEPGPEIT
jgi:hypothetical protein